MGFWKQWFAKFWLVFKLKFVEAIDIKPPLKADPCEYCPVCGHRNGHVQAVTDGTRVALRHFCEMCGWMWDQEPVTSIDQKTIVAEFLQPKEEEEAENPRFQPRFVPIPPRGEQGVQVNGEKMPDKGVGDRTKAVVAKL